MSADETSSAPAGGELAGHVRALARVLDRTGRKVTSLETHVRQLATDVARLASLTATSATSGAPAAEAAGPADGEEGGPAAVRSWLLAVDPEQAVADLAELIEWCERVFLRYPDAMLGPCWLWHPHVIEELCWLRGAHADAYDPKNGSWMRVGDWHERQRPGVARRVTTVLAKCDLTLHAPGQPHGQPPAVAPLGGHAGQVAHYWTAGYGARPEPSPAQYAEANAIQRAMHRTHR